MPLFLTGTREYPIVIDDLPEQGDRAHPVPIRDVCAASGYSAANPVPIDSDDGYETKGSLGHSQLESETDTIVMSTPEFRENILSRRDQEYTNNDTLTIPARESRHRATSLRVSNPDSSLYRVPGVLRSME